MRGLSWKIPIIYLDDIIVFTPTFNGHLEALRKVFDRLSQANLKLNPKKCFFARETISYLGHTVSTGGTSADPKKVEAVQTYHVTKNLKELRSFLGLTGYYRRFIRSHAANARPLYRLTKGDTPFT